MLFSYGIQKINLDWVYHLVKIIKHFVFNYFLIMPQCSNIKQKLILYNITREITASLHNHLILAPTYQNHSKYYSER